MKRILVVLSVVLISCANNTTSSQVVKHIEAKVFKTSIANEESIILDVRTSQEFKSGHINQATNIDFYGAEFKEKLSLVNKNVPVYVYCRSGNRSGKTAAIMESLGFKEVYNLIGGIGAWTGNNFKVVKNKSVKTVPQPSFTKQQLNSVINSNELVLIDFSTQWCVPCKKMKPIVTEIKQENKDVEVLFVDVDANKDLAKEYAVQSVPVFLVFKNGKEIFRHTGIIEKNELIKQLK